MIGWSVSPEGVNQVLAGVDTAGEAIGTAMDGLADHLAAAVEGTRSAEVAAAMQAFIDAQATDLAMIEQRIPSARAAVVAASNACTAGDIEMASSTQALAAAVWGREAASYAGTRKPSPL